MRYNLPWWILLSCLVLFAKAAGAVITVSIDRNPVHLNESFQIYFEADSSIDEDPDFSSLQQFFSILNSSQSSNISVINGNYKRSIKWTLQAMPREAGTFTVPAIRFDNEKSRPFEVKVNPARQSTAPGDDGLIFELVSDRSSLYVQSQVVVTLRLMSDRNISDYKIGDMDFGGMDVVVEPLGDISQYQTKIDDRAYLVLEKKYALFPQHSGRLNIEPIQAAVQLGSRSRSLFDPFQNSGKVVRLLSQGLTMEVLTKADSFKAQHWLPSTGIQLTEDWQGELDQLSAGLPVTRTITMTAEGLTAAQLPDLGQRDIRGINQYPDKPVLKDRRSGAGIVGKRQQKIALIATSGGRYTIPEISIPWWNLETEQLEFARIPSRTIDVQGGEDAGSDAEVDAKPESTETAEVVAAAPARANQFWIWLSVFLAAGWILSSLAWWLTRKRSMQQASDREKPVEISLSKATRRLQQACASNNAMDARDAMLSWANALKPERRFTNLNQVARFFGDRLKQNIDALNQSLYSQAAGAWSGDNLWSSCEQVLSSLKPGRREEDSPGLMPLNP
ncbi:MAG: BatD family protein [Gammaproteobacteria bacterium]